jgi:hypothetical protein
VFKIEDQKGLAIALAIITAFPLQERRLLRDILKNTIAQQSALLHVHLFSSKLRIISSA